MPDFKEIGRSLSNWGRWGDEDEVGTLNLVTPERLVAAAALVRKGRVFDLAIPCDDTGPGKAGGRPNALHMMTHTGDFPMGAGASFSDDYLCMHTQAATQWDALSHFFYDGQLYNGYSVEEIRVTGARRLGIEKIGRGVVGRGVLLDVVGEDPPWLEAGHVIRPEDLEEAERRQGVRVGPGDILCIRTGWRRRYLEAGPEGWIAGEPGIGLESCAWLREREVAAVCADNWGVEVIPSEDETTFAPLHCILIRDMGMTLGEIFDFEELVADCRGDGVWEFLLTAPPLNIPGAVGSPINPLAIK